MRSMQDNLRLRILEARGMDEAAQELRNHIEIQRFVAQGADAATLALLRQAQAEEERARAMEETTQATMAATDEMSRMATAMNAPTGLRMSLRRFQATAPSAGQQMTASSIDRSQSTRIDNVTVNFSPPAGADGSQMLDLLIAELSRRKRNGTADPLALARD